MFKLKVVPQFSPEGEQKHLAASKASKQGNEALEDPQKHTGEDYEEISSARFLVLALMLL